jgi:phosphatidylserine/phosphatidylglycerophosphate/cardiolipin synthase-like enzyme
MFVKGIQSAKQSVLLIIYTLTDQEIIDSLRHKAELGVSVEVVCDAKTSPGLSKRLGRKAKLFRRFSPGLMHQKILVVDGKMIWLGSANMTKESLRIHGNLVAAIHSEGLANAMHQHAERLKENTHYSPESPLHLKAGGQELEVWLLPNPKGVDRLIELIDGAKKTVRVAMFTWTRPDLVEAVSNAKKRGVKTAVIIDHSSGKGASAIAVKLLKQKGIPISLSQGTGLLHHKFLFIDGKTLVNGSANWTKGAFTKNDDCFIILSNLTYEQQRALERLWDCMCTESSPEN